VCNSIKQFENHSDLLKHVQSSETLKERFLLIEASPNDHLSENELKAIRKCSVRTKVIYIFTMTTPFHLRSLFDYKPDGMIHKAERLYEVVKCIINLRKGLTYYSSFMKDFINPKTVSTESDVKFT
jgi:mRNA-degrading endonuclease YafQ of YafQ-DinJ toxin-antitoxin module